MQQEMHEKKIFFLFPKMGFLDDVIKTIMEKEYEAYVISDPMICREVLKRFPHSILFINIDSGLQEREWETWIRKVMKDPEIENVQIGVFSARNSIGLRQKYLLPLEFNVVSYIYVLALQIC